MNKAANPLLAGVLIVLTSERTMLIKTTIGKMFSNNAGRWLINVTKLREASGP